MSGFRLSVVQIVGLLFVGFATTGGSCNDTPGTDTPIGDGGADAGAASDAGTDAGTDAGSDAGTAPDAGTCANAETLPPCSDAGEAFTQSANACYLDAGAYGTTCTSLMIDAGYCIPEAAGAFALQGTWRACKDQWTITPAPGNYPDGGATTICQAMVKATIDSLQANAYEVRIAGNQASTWVYDNLSDDAPAGVSCGTTYITAENGDGGTWLFINRYGNPENIQSSDLSTAMCESASDSIDELFTKSGGVVNQLRVEAKYFMASGSTLVVCGAYDAGTTVTVAAPMNAASCPPGTGVNTSSATVTVCDSTSDETTLASSNPSEVSGYAGALMLVKARYADAGLETNGMIADLVKYSSNGSMSEGLSMGIVNVRVDGGLTTTLTAGSMSNVSALMALLGSAGTAVDGGVVYYAINPDGGVPQSSEYRWYSDAGSGGVKALVGVLQTTSVDPTITAPADPTVSNGTAQTVTWGASDPASYVVITVTGISTSTATITKTLSPDPGTYMFSGAEWQPIMDLNAGTLTIVVARYRVTTLMGSAISPSWNATDVMAVTSVTLHSKTYVMTN
ncbi:MAG: hypothetical protein HYY84_14630 [Deltaproteobacteria bacterium]|nr:hypothetical protein [Deltaproteobacteria bacterium]